uniref:Uncharacterized protein n=1 Tax=Physcomitrium patens TaxID=3218 RepID=A0A2K1IC22_PHYPA|nr:hypothetical protein PHYPA_030321 [Physcomitrium patens]
MGTLSVPCPNCTSRFMETTHSEEYTASAACRLRKLAGNVLGTAGLFPAPPLT